MTGPARGATKIVYRTPYYGSVHFLLTDVTGAIIKSGMIKSEAGKHHLNISAGKLQPGIYYYTLTFEGYRITRKMIVL